MSARARARVACGLAVVAAGCGPNHIAPHTTRVRNYEPGDYGGRGQPISSGSLWEESGQGLFADFRAARVGDVVTLRIDENPNATGDAGTSMKRSSDIGIGMPNFLGFTAALQRQYPDFDPSKLVELMSNADFKGDGQTSRGSRVQAAMTVRVKRLLPNGDLYAEGSKILLVNEEELHVYISGVIRSEDIAQDNTVSSSRVADAQIEFTGRGVLTDNQEQGWLTKLLASINPF